MDEIINALQTIPVNINPNKGEIFNPNMHLMCLHCGKGYIPYNQIVLEDYAFMGFCSVRCFAKYHSRFWWLWRCIKWPFFKIRSKILIWYSETFHALPCPECGEKMFAILKNLQSCSNPDCDGFGYALRVISRKDLKFEEA